MVFNLSRAIFNNYFFIKYVRKQIIFYVVILSSFFSTFHCFEPVILINQQQKENAFLTV